LENTKADIIVEIFNAANTSPLENSEDVCVLKLTTGALACAKRSGISRIKKITSDIK
jgi:hypothetical protein